MISSFFTSYPCSLFEFGQVGDTWYLIFLRNVSTYSTGMYRNCTRWCIEYLWCFMCIYLYLSTLPEEGVRCGCLLCRYARGCFVVVVIHGWMDGFVVVMVVVVVVMKGWGDLMEIIEASLLLLGWRGFSPLLASLRHDVTSFHTSLCTFVCGPVALIASLR